MVVSLNQMKTDEVWKYLTGIYSLRKLSQMGIYRKNGTYRNHRSVDSVYARVCDADRSLINEHNAQYLLDICLRDSFELKGLKELAEYLLANFEFNQKYLDEKFKNIIRDQSGYSIADILWDNVTDEVKDRVLDKNRPDSMWLDYSIESVILYFYKKGYITFNKDKRYKWPRNYNYYINYISLGLLKKIKFKITDDLIKEFADERNGKSNKHKIEYLFTIPEFRKKVVDNPKWMFYRKAPYYKGGSLGDAFIDCWPREYQQKYIDQLKEELRLKKLKEKEEKDGL